jgi:DNA-binding transcriptional ArsR family regulator
MMAVAEDRCDLLCLDLPRAEQLRRTRLSSQAAEHFAAGAKPLGDPTRLTLAVALRDGAELCVCDLSWVAERAENLVSHHVRALRTAGLVRSRRDGKMVMYALTDRGRDLVDAVIADRVTA